MSDENRRLQAFFDGYRERKGPRPLRVLEAGCGSTSHLDVGPDARVVGIDISRAQLDQNQHLAEKIQGDLETYPLAAEDFDVIVCWDVLEHLPRPELALANFHQALRPGGIMVLAMPNLISIKGLVTKLTPYGVHVWFYRSVMRDGSAGTDRFKQFPTYLRAAIRPARLRRFAARHGLAVPFFLVYEGPVQRELRRRRPVFDWAFGSFGALTRLATFGQVDPCLSDYMAVLEKPARGTEPMRSIRE